MTLRQNREEENIYTGEIEEQLIEELELTTVTPSKDVNFRVPKSPKKKSKSCTRVIHEDLIRDDFWIEHSIILDGKENYFCDRPAC